MDESGTGAAIIMRFLEAGEHRDADTLQALATDDFTMTWPQSGERFRGRDNAFAALASQDDFPEPAGEPTIVGDGDVWVVQMPLSYEHDGLMHYVGVFELRDGRVSASTEYFATPFPPKEARAAYAEP